MKIPQITQVEFFGGPEDGRVINAELFRDFHGGDGEPLARELAVVRGDERNPRAGLQLLGHYLIEGTRGKTLRYRWRALA